MLIDNLEQINITSLKAFYHARLSLTGVSGMVNYLLKLLVWSVSSAGEHHVDIVGVTGSIPVRSTIIFEVYSAFWRGFHLSIVFYNSFRYC